MSSSEVEIRYIATEQVEHYWKAVEPMIQKAMNYTEGAYSAEDVRDKLNDGLMLLWLIYLDSRFKACCVTQTCKYPGGKTALMVICVSGEGFWRWAETLYETLRRYKQQLQVDWVRCNCRPGMARWLRKLGWKRKLIVMEM